MKPTPDAIAIEALETIDQTNTPADRVLKRALRANRHLDNAGRAAVAKGVLGVRCFEPRLTYLLGTVGLPVDARSRLAAYRIDIEGASPAAVAERIEGLPVAQLQALATQVVVWPDDPIEALAARRALPTWLAHRLIDERGPDEADALASALNQPGPIAVRANIAVNSIAALQARLRAEGMQVEPGQLAPHALQLRGRPAIRVSEAFKAGCFEVQDEGSQMIAEAVGARPDEVVIDMCAGAGGKTLALAADMQDRGTLYATDVDARRLADLRVRLGRVNLACVRILHISQEAAALDGLPTQVDRILVDAPCSALGTLRRGPDRKWQVSEAETSAYPAIQLALLRRAASRLRPGGRLVYATCTLLHAENEAVADRLTAYDPSLAPAEVLPGALPDDEPGRLRLEPHRHGTDGFFIAAWTKKAGSQ